MPKELAQGACSSFFFWSFVFLFSKNALEKYGQDRMVDVEHSLQKKKYFDE